MTAAAERTRSLHLRIHIEKLYGEVLEMGSGGRSIRDRDGWMDGWMDGEEEMEMAMAEVLHNWSLA